MIEVLPDTAFMIYLGVTVFTIMGVWLRYYLQSKKKEILTFPVSQRTCEFCRFSYLEDASKPVSRCPQCRFPNKA